MTMSLQFGSRGRPLRVLDRVAQPAAAGAAFTVLALGVVTWLPALVALARTLQRWRSDGDNRCFTGVFAVFPRCWRVLWRQSLIGTAAVAVLLANCLFLSGRSSPHPFVLLAAQAGIVAALAVHCTAFAAHAALAPDAPPADWHQRAFALAFGSPARGTALLGAAVSAVILTLPVPLGPLLFGPSVPVLLALHFAAPQPERTP
ncbi:hypothetical protein [Streptomyces sp. VRA16 Mangrove soil]|uniref:hypothetical protein n=1 Tax=Streptomyces sp. VRA16 Mangrove soil TaxID=2817434 RepID=UPI001A9D9DBF|nr:hypothetical protein [Streptomyces sp. VRA16 Mangrove soil]MBO1332971.1 hypothetical protein [Streptomyces sp. VRA16 Mangrove soil]